MCNARTYRPPFFRLLVAMIGCVTFALTTLQAATVSATFNAASDTPITAVGYTATGNTLEITLGFAPPVGTNLTVIKNTALPFISGTFSNVPNGSTVNLAYNGTTYPFVAWYYGGTGNDLVLLWPTTGLAAWGNNSSGQLGDGSTTRRTTPVTVVQSGVLAGKTVAQVARGSSHTLILTTEGKVYSSGSNTFGQLGIAIATAQTTTPVAVDTTEGLSALFGKRVISIAAGSSHSLALCSDGLLVAWGRNDTAQLGDGFVNSGRSTPGRVIDAFYSPLYGRSVVAVSAGSGHTLALCSDGTVASWGLNGSGQLGDGSTTRRDWPVAVNSSSGSSALFGRTVVAISAGTDHSLALCADGAIASWGSNLDGTIGDGSPTTTVRTTAVMVGTGSGTSALFGKSVVAIAAAPTHSLALCSDGTVAAWGLNGVGELGDGSTTRRTLPVVVNNTGGSSALYGRSVIAISAGRQNSLVLCSDNTLVAWGHNIAGQLGDASTTTRILPVTVNSASITSSLWGRKVSAPGATFGSDHSLVIYGAPTPTFKVELLGNPTQTLSDASTVDFGTTLPGKEVRTFRISNGTPNSLPLYNSSVVLSGPDSGAFALLDALPAALPPNASTDVRIALIGSTAGGKYATLRISSNTPAVSPVTITLTGTIHNNASVTLTSPANDALVLTPTDLSSTNIAITLDFVAKAGTPLTVIKHTGVSFIGAPFKNLPNGSTVNLSYNGTTYPFIAWYYGGDGNDLVLLWPTVGLSAWGDNAYGQLGDNSTTSRTTPIAVYQSGVLNGKAIVQVVRGSDHTLALSSDGKVYSWGYNGYGQLGDGTTTRRTSPVAVNTANGSSALFGKSVVALSASDYHSLALCSDGSVVAWGNNFNGQLGDGSITQRTNPVAVNTSGSSSALFGKSVVAVCAGVSHSVALCSDGSVVAWGGGSSGQIGDGFTTQRNFPVPVNTTSGASALFGKSVIAISAGNYHSLSLCSDGSVVTWGGNSFGQLGDSSTTQRNFPVTTNTTNGASALFGKSAVAISAGDSHSLALCSDGSAVAWGINSVSQLGDGSTTWRTSPVLVNTASTSSALYGRFVLALATGDSHSLALCTDGTLVAWGNNGYGQLGDGSTTTRPNPTTVNTTGASSILANRTVSALAAGNGGYHSHALYTITPPAVTPAHATGITTTTATLNTTVNPNGTATTTWFEYGPSTTYGTNVPFALSPANGLSAQVVSAALSGLTPNTTYHFRAVASIFGGTIYGDNQTLQTLPIPPLTLWKQSTFGAEAANPLIAGNTADPDGDGLANLLEYATRNSPNTSSMSPLGAPTAVLMQPGDIPARELVFPYRAEATDVRFIIKRSPDLSTWTEIYRFNGDTGQSTATGAVTGTVNAGTQTITVTDPTQGEKLFWILSVIPTP